MVRGATDKEANDIQARLLVARDVERLVRSVETKREAKVGCRKTDATSRYLDTSTKNTNGINYCPVWKIQSFLWSEICTGGVQGNYFKRAEKVGSSDPNSNALQDQVRKETCRTPDAPKTKYACIVEADESTNKRVEGKST